MNQEAHLEGERGDAAMDKLPLLLCVLALLEILIGLLSLFPSVTSAFFASEMKEGVRQFLAGSSLAFGVVVLGLAMLVREEKRITKSNDLEKFRRIAYYLTIAFAIGVVLLGWGWATRLYTGPAVIILLLIELVGLVWSWNNWPKPGRHYK